MPKVDFSGRRYGRLTVTGRAEKAGHWVCRCDCGRDEVFSTQMLTSPTRGRHQCLVCTRGPCVVCGGPIEGPGKPNRTTCSDGCKAEKDRRYHRQLEAQDEKKARRQQRRAQRQAEDPEYAERQRAYWRLRDQRREADPEKRERRRAISRQYHHAHKEQIQERKQVRLGAMSEEELAAWLERRRTSSREAKRKAWAELDEQGREALRMYQRQILSQQRLRRMMAKAQILMEKINDDDQ